MISLKRMVLGAVVAVGALAAGAAPANAAVRVFVGAPFAPVAYVPPCPGEGYVWAAGYYSGRVWYPGRWNFVGARERAFRYDRGRAFGYDHYRGIDRDRHFDHFRR
jgi:hypothetical protein